MNLDKFSLKDLTVLRAKVDAQLPLTRARDIDAAKAEMLALAAARGFALADLMGDRRPHAPARKARKPRRPSTKLRDVKTGILWAGRGRPPKGFDRSRAVAVGANG